MFLKVRAFLRQPFPFELSLIRTLLLSAGVGLFVSIFLFIFKPFGVGTHILDGRVWIIWGYGAVTFLVLTFNRIIGPAVLPGVFNESKWTVFKDLGFQFWHVISIGAANMLFASVAGTERIQLLAVPVFLLQALAVGFFPLSLGVFSAQTFLFKRNAESTRQMNESLPTLGRHQNGSDMGPETVVLSAESGKEKVEIPISELLLIKSIDNYIEIYTDDNDQVSTRILRSSLKQIEQDLKDKTFLFKCHRAFLVNIRKISKVTGNSQGYKLIFTGVDYDVPVSRKMSKDLFKLVARPRTRRSPQRSV